ncbi:alpha/beta hydrolase [Streptomyces syringium]|uniref:alpha/beta hydrolase n=1 Tax=Streptomyces syringium TaxID=76729 RepID=UPI0034520E74
MWVCEPLSQRVVGSHDARSVAAASPIRVRVSPVSSLRAVLRCGGGFTTIWKVAVAELETAFRSLDGAALEGTVSAPSGVVKGLAVLGHGAGVTREEGGFFARLARGLAGAGIRCLRFDLRAHGASTGRPEEITIAGVANDIRAACDHLRVESGLDRAVHVIAASFSGGAAALHAVHRPQDVERLVLLNPRIDYRERYITSRPYVTEDGGGKGVGGAGVHGAEPLRAGPRVAERGFLPRPGDLRGGRPRPRSWWSTGRRTRLCRWSPPAATCRCSAARPS